jgi:ABC-2 type transport system ATP-binding protein
MRKKLYLAAVIATRPRLLLLDEPTTGLDPRSARRLKDLLITMRGTGTTIFLSTHLLPTAEEVCDRVGILSNGRLLAEGTMDELRALRGENSLEEIFLRLTEEAKPEDASPASS